MIECSFTPVSVLTVRDRAQDVRGALTQPGRSKLQQVALLQTICLLFLVGFFFHHAWRYDGWECFNLRKLSASFATRHTFKRVSSR